MHRLLLLASVFAHTGQCSQAESELPKTTLVGCRMLGSGNKFSIEEMGQTGLALSGGGAPAASIAAGFVQYLHVNQKLQKPFIDIIGTNSGAGWVAPAVLYEPVNTGASKLDLDVLVNAPSDVNAWFVTAAPKTSILYGAQVPDFVRQTLLRLPQWGDRAWSSTLASNIYGPKNLWNAADRPLSLTYPITAPNSQYAGPHLTPRSGMPVHVAMTTIRTSNNSQMMPIDVSAYSYGGYGKLVTKQWEKSTATFGNRIEPLCIHADSVLGVTTRVMTAKINTELVYGFSLGDVIGTSSFAPGYATSSNFIGQLITPSARNTFDYSTGLANTQQTSFMIDGYLFDNMVVTPLILRGVRTMVVSAYSADSLNTMTSVGSFFRDIGCLFGAPYPDTICPTIFQPAELTGLFEGLKYTNRGGKEAAVWTSTHTTVQNEDIGLEAGIQVQITWAFVTAAVEGFERYLREINASTNTIASIKALPDFPNYKIVRPVSSDPTRVVMLPLRQSNAMALFGQYLASEAYKSQVKYESDRAPPRVAPPVAIWSATENNLEGRRVLFKINQRYLNIDRCDQRPNPAPFCNGVLVHTVDSPHDAQDGILRPLPTPRPIVAFSFVRRDIETKTSAAGQSVIWNGLLQEEPDKRIGLIFDNALVHAPESPRALCLYVQNAISNGRDNCGCGDFRYVVESDSPLTCDLTQNAMSFGQMKDHDYQSYLNWLIQDIAIHGHVLDAIHPYPHRQKSFQPTATGFDLAASIWPLYPRRYSPNNEVVFEAWPTLDLCKIPVQALYYTTMPGIPVKNLIAVRAAQARMFSVCGIFLPVIQIDATAHNATGIIAFDYLEEDQWVPPVTTCPY